MSKRAGIASTIIVVGLLAVVWLVRNTSVPGPVARPVTAPPQVQPSSAQPPVGSAPPFSAPEAVPTPAVPPPAPMADPLPPSERRDMANPLAPASVPEGPQPRPAEEDPTTAAALDRISLMIRDYRTIAGENPVGTNAEIMKAMMGDNPRGATLGPPEGMSMNDQGELLDGWGTPIFFHQISRDVMEIHSAGPDRRLGTEDDLILK